MIFLAVSTRRATQKSSTGGKVSSAITVTDKEGVPLTSRIGLASYAAGREYSRTDDNRKHVFQSLTSPRQRYAILYLKYMSFFLSGKREFTPAQIERFANIFDNAGQVFLAVMVLTSVVQGIDKANILVLVFGIVDMLLCWAVSIILAKRKDK